MRDVDDIEEFYVQLGERIRTARTKGGITQQELGALVGLTRTSIANIESGRQRCLAHVMIRLHALLGFEVPGTELMFATAVDDQKRRRLAQDVRQLRARLSRIRAVVLAGVED